MRDMTSNQFGSACRAESFIHQSKSGGADADFNNGCASDLNVDKMAMRKSRESFKHSAEAATSEKTSKFTAHIRFDSGRGMIRLSATASDSKFSEGLLGNLKGIGALSIQNSENSGLKVCSDGNRNVVQRQLLVRESPISSKTNGLVKLSKKITSGLSSNSGGIAGKGLNSFAKAVAMAAVMVLNTRLCISDAFGQLPQVHRCLDCHDPANKEKLK